MVSTKKYEDAGLPSRAATSQTQYDTASRTQFSEAIYGKCRESVLCNELAPWGTLLVDELTNPQTSPRQCLAAGSCWWSGDQSHTSPYISCWPGKFQGLTCRLVHF